MFRTKQTPSPAACAAVGMLATVGVISLCVMAKRVVCRSGARLKRFGRDCADAVEEGIDDLCDCDCGKK